ncbi:nicotinamide mononucleotide transporter [Candidatus Saccharibacteria bacterium]|nr:nicotinamide mononucleotide transporter [Candidatus Saccharibacteria bacterium]
MKTSRKTKNKETKLTTTNIAVILACIIVPAIIGFYSGDLLIGGSLLAANLLGSYTAIIQKRINYVFDFISALLVAFVGYENDFFGSFFMSLFIFAPIEIAGFLAWGRHLDKKKKIVEIRKLTPKNAFIVTSLCVLGSITFGYLLTKIPTQQMAFLDSTICCLDICALILFSLRYRESWWLWVISGALSVIMWSIALFEGGDNSFMRLLTAIGFLIFDTYGAINWHQKLKKP